MQVAPIAPTLVSTRGHHGTQGAVRQLLRSFDSDRGKAHNSKSPRVRAGRAGLGSAGAADASAISQKSSGRIESGTVLGQCFVAAGVSWYVLAHRRHFLLEDPVAGQ